MQRPRLIATAPVLHGVRELLAHDEPTKREMAALLERTNTIFDMDLLSYGDESYESAAEAATDVDDEVIAEVTPLEFLPTASAFEPFRHATHQRDGDFQLEGLLPKGFKPIEIAKAGLSRMQALGAAWQLKQDPKYARRGVEEMRALCRLKHWGAKHHLAVATFMQALAIGYDWLHDGLQEPDKAAIRQALIDKGFNAMREAFDAKRQPNWITVPSNWNIVCNASLIMAALAIEPDTNDQAVGYVKNAAVKSLEVGLRLFDDDGSWKLEGPGYWHLATEHLAYLQSALDGADDPAAAMLATPAIANTGFYRCYMTAPSTLLFNFGDSAEQRPGLWWMRWFGTHFKQPVFYELAADRSGKMGAAREVHPMDILWRQPPDKLPPGPLLPSLPTARVFSEVAVLRGAWDSPTAAYVGIKGGRTSGLRSHSHLDLGHFVYEVGGRRWAIDLEPDDYTECYLAPPERYRYYRAGTFGHNTLVIDDVNQAYAPGEPMIGAVFSPLVETERATAISLDLSTAYPMASSVKRTFTLDRSGDLTIEDEIRPRAAAMTVVWSMHTRALVECDGRCARLTQTYGAGHEAIVLYATLDGPEGVEFACVDAGPAVLYEACEQAETPTSGVKRLSIALGSITEPTRLRVRLSMVPV